MQCKHIHSLGNQKPHLTCFTAIFNLLQWSGNRQQYVRSMPAVNVKIFSKRALAAKIPNIF